MPKIPESLFGMKTPSLDRTAFENILKQSELQQPPANAFLKDTIGPNSASARESPDNENAL